MLRDWALKLRALFGQPMDCKTYGHFYQARYEKRLPEHLKNASNITLEVTGAHGKMPDMSDLILEIHYIHDICIKCGKIVERKGSGNGETQKTTLLSLVRPTSGRNDH